MPEAIFLCIDCSDYTRNGDFFPNRMMAAQESANLVFGARMSANPENTMGLLTMGGAAVEVRETLTNDVDRLMAALTHISPGGEMRFATALQIASLALSHRNNPRAEKRAVLFVASPVTEPPATLERLAKRLKKDDVAVDIVSFGVPENTPILERFVSLVDKSRNSHFIPVPREQPLVDAILNSVLINGDESGGGGAGVGGGAGGVGGGFGGDGDMDAQMAMVLRMSLEEERLRQEAAARAAAGGGAPAAPSAEQPVEDLHLSEEEELRRAIELSMAEEAAAAAAAANPPASSSGAPAAPAPAIGTAAYEAAFANEDWMRELAREAGVESPAGGAPPPGGSGAQPPAGDGKKGDGGAPPPQPPAS